MLGTGGRAGPDGDSLTHLNLGSAYLESGDLEAAQLKAEQSIEQDPQNARAHDSDLRGVVLQRRGQAEQARAAYARALELAPQSPDAASNLAAVGAAAADPP